jgi:serine/threonine protein kinase
LDQNKSYSTGAVLPEMPDCPYTLKYLQNVRVFKKYKVKLSDFGNSTYDQLMDFPTAEQRQVYQRRHSVPWYLRNQNSAYIYNEVLCRPTPYQTLQPSSPPHRIQTRQYRSPEAIIGAHCMFFILYFFIIIV